MSAPAGQTFSSPIQGHVSSPDGSAYYVAAHPSLGSPGAFAVSAASFTGGAFYPFTPELVTLNNNDGLADPLYNQNIALIGLLSAIEAQSSNRSRIESPIVVTSSDPTSVYVIDTFYKKTGGAVESAIGIKDAAGAVTSGIVGLGNMSNVYAIAATKANAGGNFGAIGSGLGIIQLASNTITDAKSSMTQRVFMQIPFFGVGAYPLDVNSTQIKIQDNLAAITNNVAMHWDENLGRMYVGLQITAGGAAGDGGLSVVIFAERQNQRLVCSPLRPQQYSLQDFKKRS